jgi:hypothetical protein
VKGCWVGYASVGANTEARTMSWIGTHSAEHVISGIRLASVVCASSYVVKGGDQRQGLGIVEVICLDGGLEAKGSKAEEQGVEDFRVVDAHTVRGGKGRCP